MIVSFQLLPMRKTKWIKFFKKLHKWPAIIIAFIAMLFAASGIVMNHRSLFSKIDISRKLLPANYTYSNWNQSALRGSLTTEGRNFIYGNIGVWEFDNQQTEFTDFNQGFPEGIDNRKVYSLKEFKNELFAATHFGLFRRNNESDWEKLQLPVKNERITDLTIKADTLIILTRNYLLKTADGETFQKIQLPEPINYKRETGLFDTFWQLHSGELFGLTGKLIVDLLGLVTIVLSITGLLHFSFPKIIRRRKRKTQTVKSLVSTKKTNLHWHNVVGYIFALFLLINTFAGIHLRPPLLIAIANKKVEIIPGTHLDSPNPWQDKLRRVLWDENRGVYIFSTSEGFFFATENLNDKLIPAPVQPPVSVMGCNVLEFINLKQLLVGSFSGMFVWNLETGAVNNFFSGDTYIAPSGMARPIASNMVTGLIQNEQSTFWVDYNRGIIGLNGQSFPAMSGIIHSDSPMSLWNVSQEIHTGRIFESFLGPFYILFVPFAGICLLIVLISGVLVWWWVYRR